ncbi:MAG: aldo/keto reductase [Deltaproteobacteria bacterium]|nr:aldo/keto reductase [Deltaproteobacteria bacterium]
MIPRHSLGAMGVEVSAFGLGGEGILRTHGRHEQASELIRQALDLGVTYFESARAYSGSEGYLGQSLGADRQRIFLATKSHERTAAGAQEHLRESLTLLGTDWIDLWMVHDVRTRDELEQIAGPGGALEVFAKAKQRGAARFLGVSGHHDPAILRAALDLFPFDCVLMPVNPAEGALNAFADEVLPTARARGMGVIAMKVLCRGLVAQLPGFMGTAPYLRYALQTEGVSLVSIGCENTAQIRENLEAVVAVNQPTEGEREGLERLLSPYARKLAYYRP